MPRVLTAVIGVPLILLLIHTGGLPFSVFIGAASMLSLMELFSLLDKAGFGARRLIGYPAAVLLFISFILPASADTRLKIQLHEPALLGFALSAAVIAMTVAEIFYVKTRSLARCASTLFAVLFATWPLAHVVLLRELIPLGKEWCLFLFVTIWATDTLAYIAGSSLGKKKIAPRISPKKSLEGLFGGILGAVSAASILWLVYFRPAGLPYGETAILGAGLGIIGQLSDLVESMIKREAQVKDSSDLLPGHGGILDRFDSFFLTAPLLYYYFMILGRGQ